MIPQLRQRFNAQYTDEKYAALNALLASASGSPISFRVSETPVFVPKSLLERLAALGAELAARLIADEHYLNAARNAIPPGFCAANETSHPHFLTADFALIRDLRGELVPRLVEIQAFPSVFAYQQLLCSAYRQVYGLPEHLDVFLSGLDETSYWSLLQRTIVGRHAPENVVLTEVDPIHQKTLPDFLRTAQRLGIAIVDIATLKPVGNQLHYTDAHGRLVPIHRIYNRAIADELIARQIQLPFAWTNPWQVEWAGHPNWYFLISKFSVPWLWQNGNPDSVIPPAVFLNDFLEGPGRDALRAAGVPLPEPNGPGSLYRELLLKPLFGFAGKGIQFAPSDAELRSIPVAQRGNYLLQQRMHFEPAIDTPHGPTQAEFRILYLWPDGEKLTPALSLVRLGRGKMMGVDHNKSQRWTGASAAFFPRE